MSRNDARPTGDETVQDDYSGISNREAAQEEDRERDEHPPRNSSTPELEDVRDRPAPSANKVDGAYGKE